MKKFLILGTDTGVGKTFFSGLLAAAYEKQKSGSVLYIKPFQTGTTSTKTPKKASKKMGNEEEADVHSLNNIVREKTGHSLTAKQLITLRAYPLAASPHLSATQAGKPLTKPQLHRVAKELHKVIHKHKGDCVIIEGVGGVLVPLVTTATKKDPVGLWTFADFISSLPPELLEDLDIFLIARTGLGTLNHSLMTIEALKKRNLSVKAIFLNDYLAAPPSDDTTSHAASHKIILHDNAQTLSNSTHIPVTRFSKTLLKSTLTKIIGKQAEKDEQAGKSKQRGKGKPGEERRSREDRRARGDRRSRDRRSRGRDRRVRARGIRT